MVLLRPTGPWHRVVGSVLPVLGRAAGAPTISWLPVVVAAVVLLAAVLLRLDRLAERSLSHPEVSVPGIRLPRGIAEPPARYTFRKVLWWHFHSDVHPHGYNLLMLCWTKLCGTSLTSIRLPSVLFGVGSVALLGLTAGRVHGWKVGLLAAALLACNGQHIYFSQQARLYSLLCFLGLLSTLLLLLLAKERRPRPGLETLYVVVCWLGAFTEIFFWLLLAAQMLWTVMVGWRAGRPLPRLVALQAVVVMLGTPLLVHAVYYLRPSYLAAPSWPLLQEYLAFGFLLRPDLFSDPVRPVPAMAMLAATLLAIASLAVALRQPGLMVSPGRGTVPLSLRLTCASAASLVSLALAWLAWRRQGPMALAGVLIPLAALALPPFLRRVGPLLARGGEWGARVLPGLCSPFVFLALGPCALLFVVSFWFPLLESRVFLLFTPYLLAVLAVGLVRLAEFLVPTLCVGTHARPLYGNGEGDDRRVAPCDAARRGLSFPRRAWERGRSALLTGLFLFVLAVLHTFSVLHYRDFPFSPRDYQRMAQLLATRTTPGDLIFVHDRSWRTTPLFYYLDDRHHRFVANGYATAIAHAPAARVWVVTVPAEPMSAAMRDALAGYHMEQELHVLRICASLHVRDSVSPGLAP